MKQSIRNAVQNESKDVDTLLGTRQSVSSYKKRRLSLYFESKENALQSKIYIFQKFCLDLFLEIYKKLPIFIHAE